MFGDTTVSSPASALLLLRFEACRAEGVSPTSRTLRLSRSHCYFDPHPLLFRLSPEKKSTDSLALLGIHGFGAPITSCEHSPTIHPHHPPHYIPTPASHFTRIQRGTKGSQRSYQQAFRPLMSEWLLLVNPNPQRQVVDLCP